MALSLGFGILFATVITLFMVPTNVMIVDDFKRLIRRLLGNSGALEKQV